MGSTLRVLPHIGLVRDPQKEPGFTYLTTVHLQRNKSPGPPQGSGLSGNSRQMWRPPFEWRKANAMWGGFNFREEVGRQGVGWGEDNWLASSGRKQS